MLEERPRHRAWSTVLTALTYSLVEKSWSLEGESMAPATFVFAVVM